MRMWTEDRAASTSARIRGKNSFPSTHGSIDAAIDHTKRGAASRGTVPSRARNAAVAACAPSAVMPSTGGGQLGRCSIRSRRRWASVAPPASSAGTRSRAMRGRYTRAYRAFMRLGRGVCMAMLLAGCGGDDRVSEDLPRAPAALRLSTPAFIDGSRLPQRYTCDGAGEEPPMQAGTVPPSTKELVLIVSDPDAPDGSYVHLTRYGLSPRGDGSVDHG